MRFVKLFVVSLMKTLHMFQEKLDPIDDIEVINLELILADMESVDKAFRPCF